MTSAKACRKCAVPLVLGDNWRAQLQKTSTYLCIPCFNKRALGHYHASKLKRERKHHIYVVVNENYPGKVKVGMVTYDPRHRLRHYNTGCPYRAFRYAALIPVADAVEAEKKAHDLLAQYHFSHEWFTCPAKTAIDVVESLAA